MVVLGGVRCLAWDGLCVCVQSVVCRRASIIVEGGHAIFFYALPRFRPVANAVAWNSSAGPCPKYLF